MKEKGIIFDLEGILIFYEVPKKEEEELVLNFLIKKQYIFHVDDLEGKTALEFANTILHWRENDDIFINEERAKLRRKYLINAQGDHSAAGVLQMLSRSHEIVVLAKSQGDGIIHALAKAGIRNHISFIVPGEKWLNKSPTTLGLDLAMEKYAKIALDNWVYVGLPSSVSMAKEANITFLPYKTPQYKDLEDIMEELT